MLEFDSNRRCGDHESYTTVRQIDFEINKYFCMYEI